MNTSEFLMQAATRGTLLLVAGFGAAWLLSRVSAAVRHYLWTIVFCALLALPAAMTMGPKWALPAPVSGTVLTVRPDAAATNAPAPAPARINPLPWLYFAGVLMVAARFTAGAWRTRKMLSGGTTLQTSVVPSSVRVIESSRVPVPLAWGVFRPVIALPTASRHWPADRMRTVLLHELIHVERRDLLAQWIAQAACCLYWFHPLAWLAAREMRKERELACDDAVLLRGIAPAEYARHLVELVRGLTVAAPAMAEASGFEGRVRALLDAGRNRKPLTRRFALGVAAMACALILPVGSVVSYAQGDRGALAGVVTDPSDSRAPAVEVLAKNLDGGNQETTVTDGAGEYGFRAIPPGRYELQFQARGFKLGRQQVLVTAGGVSRADGRLQLGEATERLTVKGEGKKAQAPALAQGTSQGVPVGGNVQPSRLLRQPKARYPAQLEQQGVTGEVILRGVVGIEGRFTDLRVVNTEVHPGLAQAALDAVRQWLYQPARLNGQPVETATTITINFELNP